LALELDERDFEMCHASCEMNENIYTFYYALEMILEIFHEEVITQKQFRVNFKGHI